MKKIFTLMVVLFATVSIVKANVEFAYDAGAEIVSAYIWRGMYNGGLSFQPDVEIGFDGENSSFRIGAWGNIGASDWKFQKGLPKYPDDSNPNTYFVPELDIVGSFSIYGLSLGFNHYYYCDGSNFFSWQKAQDVYDAGNTSTTEVWAGYNFGHFFGDKAGAYLNWYTTVAGNDVNVSTIYPFMAPAQDVATRAWSSYLEVGYDFTFETIGLTVGAQVGMSPWKSPIYGNEKFAVVNVSAKVDKAWEFDVVTLNLFAQGSINPDGLVTNPKDADYNLFVNAAGDDKIGVQRLNGAIGLGIWF